MGTTNTTVTAFLCVEYIPKGRYDYDYYKKDKNKILHIITPFLSDSRLFAVIYYKQSKYKSKYRNCYGAGDKACTNGL